jgi:iron complex transport system permease protein
MPTPAPEGHGARKMVVLLALAALLLAACVLRLCVGRGFPAWPEGSLGRSALALLWARPGAADLYSIMGIRLTAVVLACLAGAALASSGVALQALLRNPLAEPFVLGLSSGAALGVVGQIVLQWKAPAHVADILRGPAYLGALIGASAAMAIVFCASRRRGVIDPLGLLLTGVVLSSICGSLLLMALYLVGRGQLDTQLSRWMMGYLDPSVVGTLWFSGALVVVALGVAALAACGPAMDVATFSDTEAASLGVSLPRLRTVLFLASSVLAAAAVVVAGPLAFVGLICPHLGRLLLGPAHRPLVLGSCLLGALLVVGADIAGNLLDRLTGIGVMPIGVFTALVGGPVFLWILRPQLGRGAE